MRILLVEDEIGLSDALVQILAKNKYMTDACYDGVSGLDNALTGIHDVIILDIMLPGMNGLEVLREIRRNKLETPVILLTAKDEISDKVTGLDYGADDYITKPFGVMELISRVKALLRRTSRMNEDSQLIHEDILMDMDKHAVTVAGQLCELTFKEFELLKYLMLNQGIVLSRDKIMDQVWGFEYEGESRTVDMHIKTLRQKLGAAGSCIKTVRNVGYMIE